MNKRNTYKLIHLLPQELDFGRVAKWTAKKVWDLFHIDLKTAFLQGSEASDPSYIAARLKKLAYGRNDALQHWWNILDNALCTCGMHPTRTDRC